MNEQDNVSLIRKIYAAFAAGDAQTILDSVTDNAQWINHGPATVPYAGSRAGKSANRRVLSSYRELDHGRESHGRELRRPGGHGGRDRPLSGDCT